MPSETQPRFSASSASHSSLRYSNCVGLGVPPQVLVATALLSITPQFYQVKIGNAFIHTILFFVAPISQRAEIHVSTILKGTESNLQEKTVTSTALRHEVKAVSLPTTIIDR